MQNFVMHHQNKNTLRQSTLLTNVIKIFFNYISNLFIKYKQSFVLLGDYVYLNFSYKNLFYTFLR